MPSFFTGDELGAIKTIRYDRTEIDRTWQPTSKILVESGSSDKARAVQKLAVLPGATTDTLLAASRADGSTSVIKVSEAAEVKVTSEWKEPRLKEGQVHVGLSFTQNGVYSCTSNGALRLTKLGDEDSLSHQLAVLPMRLTEWRLSPTENTFAYAGDEVELSLWDTERTFSGNSVHTVTAEAKKRKRGDQLLPHEIWRAKNLANDSLNLRQPVRNTCLTFLQSSASSSHQHLLVGTQFGDIRRYDSRAARRPVANWKGVGKVTGIGVLENGLHEHEAFVSDHGCNLFALDLRNGKISYGFKGLAGSVTSIAPSPSFLASTAEDRYLRLHSTFPPPPKAGQQQEKKGEILDKLYMKAIPTVAVWDGISDNAAQIDDLDTERVEDDGDDVWDQMEDAEDEQEGQKRKKSKSSQVL